MYDSTPINALFLRLFSGEWITPTPSMPYFYGSFRDRFYLRRSTERRKPWTFDDHVFHMIWRYSCQHSHSQYQFARKVPFANSRLMGRSATAELKKLHSLLRWSGFSPVTSWEQRSNRPVSCYAFFKEWLPPSPSPGCQSSKTSFPTKPLLWDLSKRLGLFPSRPWTLAPKVCLLLCIYHRYSEFPWGW